MEIPVVAHVRTRASMRMRGLEEKDDSELFETLSLDPPAAKVTHLLSKKLLIWGVEARGEHFVSRSSNSIPD
jgi:hypothetical protein